ncbi:MAG: type II toxin-antitoxin system RelE/ParE family toxin [Gammaproteobacteria bacterium]|nr:type II toxin-antitoxin system RelE/ParE family toxin [Gammaproteobacteria bacterium]
MNIRSIKILSDAVIDLEDGRNFYEKQERRVGGYFWDCLLSDIESLIIYGGVNRKEYGYYRMLSRRFPYSIYYDVSDEAAYIIAILPMRRDPDWIRERISKRS